MVPVSSRAKPTLRVNHYCVAYSISSIAETRDRALSSFLGKVDFMRWFLIVFLTNGVSTVTHGGIKVVGRGSIPGRFISKTWEMIHDISLHSIQHFGKVHTSERHNATRWLASTGEFTVLAQLRGPMANETEMGATLFSQKTCALTTMLITSLNSTHTSPLIFVHETHSATRWPVPTVPFTVLAQLCAAQRLIKLRFCTVHQKWGGKEL